MNKKIFSFLLLLFGTALLYTAVRFSIFEPSAFKGYGDILNAIFRTTLVIFGLVVDGYGILPLFKKEPPALSVTPDTAKLSLDLPLIGRLEDLSWLQNKYEDKVLIGQPGSGKTFLLYKFAKQGEALFVNDYNLKRVTSEFRRKKPRVVIIDDAQLHLEFISGLISYRKRKSGKFEILVSCWPSHEADVLSALNIPNSNAHYLNLLTLDHLVEVVKAVAIGWQVPDGLIQEIVEQSVGRPGLAVTLTEICLKEGGVQDIVLGNALARWVTTKLLPITNSEDASAVLAGFSIGGDVGMPMDVVAEELGINLLKVQSITSNLVGGLIFDNTPNLVVYPPALRHSLVSDKFFRGALSLTAAGFIKNAPSLYEVAKTLMGAKRRGANVQQELLLEILERLNSGNLWEEFAYLGEIEATWVLENKPQYLIVIARPILENIPNKGIPFLLSAAIGDDRELHSTTDHPVRIIQDWVLSAVPGKDKAIQRREILLDSVSEWISKVGHQRPAIRALQIIMSPEFSRFSPNPGSGDTWTITSGHLTASEILSLKVLWANILPIVRKISINEWLPIRQIIENWAYPGRSVGNIAEEIYDGMNAFAGQMVLDILPLISKHPGFLHWAHNISRAANLSIEVPVDSFFEILYPEVDPISFHEDPSRQQESIVVLAQQLTNKDPKEIIHDLLRIENEAQLVGDIWPRLTPLLCLELSKTTAKQNSWIEVGIKEGLPGDLLRPFLNKVMEVRGKGWIGILQKCLHEQSLKPHVVEMVLTDLKMPKVLLDDVYDELDNLTKLIEILCLRKEIPEDRVLKLLKHNNPDVATSVAKGEWTSSPVKSVRESLNEQWEKVVVNFPLDDYLLSEIFMARPALALAWLSARIRETINDNDSVIGFRMERAFGVAANSLSFEDRRSLLKTIAPFRYDYLVVTHLIGDNVELYQELLINKEMKHLHLDPLYGKPTDAWALKAIAAMRSGYSAKDIAHATRWGEMKIVSWSGNESKMWDEWIKCFEPFLLHSDEQIREVAKISIENARYKRDNLLREELKKAVFGRNY